MRLRIQEWLAERGVGQFPRELYLRVTLDDHLQHQPIGVIRFIGLSFVMLVLCVAFVLGVLGLGVGLYFFWLFATS